MTVDPSDDCTFWYTNEYLIASADGTNKWSTRIGSFKFPSCGATRVPAKLKFQLEPDASYAANTMITVKVAVEDSSGLVVDSDNSQVTLALQGGTVGATLGGTTTVNAVNGVATFSVSVDSVGTGYALHATDGALTAANSSSFAIVAGSPANIAFTQQPSDAVAGVANSPAIVVTVTDGLGNPIAGDTVNLAVASGPGSLTVTNGQTTDANGNATFADAVLTVEGMYTLSATETGAALFTTSNAFNIVAGVATQLVFTIQPADVMQGDAIATIAVTEEDAGGNVVADNATSTDFSVPACGGNVDLGSAVMVNGVATLSGSTQRFYVLAGSLQITAADAALSIGGQSQAFGVIANPDLVFNDGFDGCRL
jgi:hypothetical protein